MKKNKKIIIGAAAAVAAVIVAAVCIVAGNMNKDNSQDNEDRPSIELKDESKEPMTERPVFMYFVSENDERHEETEKIVEELKAEYEGRVDFQIMSVDENPEYIDNYSLNVFNTTGSPTPTLLMVDVMGMPRIKAGFADKAALEEVINSVMQ